MHCPEALLQELELTTDILETSGEEHFGDESGKTHNNLQFLGSPVTVKYTQHRIITSRCVENKIYPELKQSTVLVLISFKEPVVSIPNKLIHKGSVVCEEMPSCFTFLFRI